MKLDRATVCLPIKDRLVSHAFYTAPLRRLHSRWGITDNEVPVPDEGARHD